MARNKGMLGVRFGAVTIALSGAFARRVIEYTHRFDQQRSGRDEGRLQLKNRELSWRHGPSRLPFPAAIGRLSR
jgi:hypothetical protein